MEDRATLYLAWSTPLSGSYMKEAAKMRRGEANRDKAHYLQFCILHKFNDGEVKHQ